MKNLKVIFVNSIDFDSNADDLPLGLMILDKICRENSYDSEIVDFGTLLKKGLFDKNCDLDSLIDQMADHLLLKEADVIVFYGFFEKSRKAHKSGVGKRDGGHCDTLVEKKFPLVYFNFRLIVLLGLKVILVLNIH